MGADGRSAVLLAGGGSRRLGRAKPFVDVGGRTVLERQLEAIEGVRDIVIAVRDPAPFERALIEQGWEGEGRRLRRGDRTIRIVPDPHPGRGPVAGLASGLAPIEAERAVVLAADLPFVSAGLIEGLDAALAASPEADAVVPRVDGRLQPLCAAYRRGVAGPAAALVSRASGRGASMRDLMSRISVRTLEEADWADAADLARAVRGIDTECDLRWAREVARG